MDFENKGSLETPLFFCLFHSSRHSRAIDIPRRPDRLISPDLIAHTPVSDYRQLHLIKSRHEYS
jgi:hypothetical protein